jgi:uncharacterized protein (TIGR03118 family)
MVRCSTLARSALAAVFIVSCLGTAAVVNAGKEDDNARKEDRNAGKEDGYVETDLVVNKSVNNVPTLTDKNGIVHIARFFDPNLLNPWGVGESATSPFWVSDNNAGKSTLYDTQGAPQARVVSIPAPGDPLGASGTPTGLVFNTAQGQQAFKISGVDSAGVPTTAPAVFLFATEDGTIVGWNPNVNPEGFESGTAGMHGIIAVDNSSVTHPESGGAVYKGLAIAMNGKGATFLYATDFRGGKVDIYDANFATVASFTDPKLPHHYAPFNVVPIGDELFVTFAVQNDAKHDDVAGEGHGIVDVFEPDGELRQRFAQHGQLNSPWGVALAPRDFGELGGSLLIGNFGNGHINAFDPDSGRFLGKVRDPKGKAILIEGLWTIMFGNGGNGGATDTLYFTAGPNGEQDGLFGSLNPN